MANDKKPWRPAVEQHPHPPGERGVNYSLEQVAERASQGSVDPRIRAWAIECLDRARKRDLPVKGSLARARVLLRAVQEKLWVPDPVAAEFMAGAHLTACVDKDAPCFRGGDCFPVGTLLLTDEHKLLPIEEVRAGTKIWGLNQWTEVQASKYKGILPVTVITLNNGSQVKLTEEHFVTVAECEKHSHTDDKPCSCPVDTRALKKLRVSELQEGMVLLTPDRLPFGKEETDVDRAYIEGLYIADGWSDQNSRFCISGKDGFPKEEQKHFVEKYCSEQGIHTRWHEKYIAVNDSEWSLRMQQMGSKARDKHLLSLNLGEGTASAYLRGVMADSGKNTKGPGRTLTTTSRLLAIQARVLHKMFGISCGWRYIENHGGLGENPIYRLGVRGNMRADGRAPWLLRIKDIERNVVSAPCYDIQTEDHYVYLPEHDVTVNNCDDLTVLLAAAFASVGIHTLIVGHAYDKGRHISHVLAAAYASDQWWYADPSTDFPLGKCEPFTRERLLGVPNAKLICDKDVCIGGPKKISPEDVEPVQGTFVGVNGLPEQEEPDVRWISSNFVSVQGIPGDAPVELSSVRWLKGI